MTETREIAPTPIKTELFLSKYLNKSNLPSVLQLGQNPNSDFAERITEDLNNIYPGDLAVELLDGISRDDELWDVDRRDGALEILKLVNFEEIDSRSLYVYYNSKLEALGEDSDAFGTFTTLLEAGKIIISKCKPPGTLGDLLQPTFNFPRLYGVFSKKPNDERKFIFQELEKFGKFVHEKKLFWINEENKEQEKLRLRNEQETQTHIQELLNRQEIPMPDPEPVMPVRLATREMPSFDKAVKFLYDQYIENTKKNKTFKVALWENTPEFRRLCVENGIRLENFWNINNPDEVAQQVISLRQIDSPFLKERFSRVLQEETGLSLDAVTEEQTRYLADEIVSTAIKAKVEVLGSIRDFNDVVSKLIQIADDSKDLPSKARASKLKPVINFLRENGYETTESDSTLPSVLHNPEIITKLRTEFERKQDVKREAVQVLEQTFKLSEKQQQFTLASRTKEDLYLGDLTGDCTAFHLQTGFNVWTVPVWLSNPGFTFYKMNDKNGNLVAKAGFLLAITGGKPVIVMDSFETAKNITNEGDAKEQIREGLKYLDTWAYNRGFEGVRMSIWANSSGVSEILGSLSRTEPSGMMVALGGLSGIAEVRKNLKGPDSTENIYLQSVFHEESVTFRTERLEQEINKTLAKLNKKEKELFQNALNEQNWDMIFSLIMKKNYPDVSRTLGSNYDIYKREYISSKKNKDGNFHTRKQFYDDYDRPLIKQYDDAIYEEIRLRNKISQETDRDLRNKISEELRVIEDKRKGIGLNLDNPSNEVVGAADFLEELHRIFVSGSTPEKLLGVLYARTGESTDKKDIRLSENLHLLTVR